MSTETLPSLDWTEFGINAFRHKGILPIKATVVVAQSFTKFILGSVSQFLHIFNQSALGDTTEGITMQIKSQIRINGVLVDTHPRQIYIDCEYLGGASQVVIIDPRPTVH